ncbi:MAG: ASKHA domain-containing protein [Candidatus Omnitrophota bacterium]
MKKISVTFNPGNKKIDVAKGESLLSAAIDAGLSLNVSCGGGGLCGKCRVVVRSGKVSSGPSTLLSDAEKNKGVVLACMSTIIENVTIDVPPETMVEFQKESKTFLRVESIDAARESAAEKQFSLSPIATKVYLEVPEPTLDDNISDLDRLYRSIEEKMGKVKLTTHLSNVKSLGSVLRNSDFKVTATIGKRGGADEILFIESGNTESSSYGMAFDIGTTTVSGTLVDLRTRKSLGTATSYNRQSSFGSDVITRIVAASESAGLVKLHSAIVATMNEIIKSLANDHGVRLSDIVACSAGGNMTMTQLFLSVDPRFIRREPYVPTMSSVEPVHAAELGIQIHPKGLVSCVPGVSTYVGGDITAGIISSGLCDRDEVSLLIDIGTNGEVVLGNKEWMVGCSASAGPAFEGSGVTCGMRAVAGAIESAAIDPGGACSVKTIGDDPPRGICGSGYISLLSELFRAKYIDRDGKYADGRPIDRIRSTKSGKEFVVVWKKDSGIKEDIVITEDDIENLKRSKGAIYSAIHILLLKMELSIENIKRIYIAGGFGAFINIDSAVRIGLLPDTDRAVYSFIGNASLSGTRDCLLSSDARKKAKLISEQVTYVDLSTEPKYMDEYVASLFFPHTDVTRFGSVLS